jgi:ABC-type branched-subunit amino acid transport system ATPase component
MYIKTFAIENYKSFRLSGDRHLSDGFNVIVGQNNAGKTALAEALSMGFGSHPHRSLATKPTPESQLAGNSRVTISIALEREELTDLLVDHFQQVYVKIPDGSVPQSYVKQFTDQYFAAQSHEIRATSEGGAILAASLSWYDVPYLSDRNNRILNFQMDREERRPIYVNEGNSVHNHLLAFQLAERLKSRIYRFKAERTIPDASPFGDGVVLRADAVNLANALHDLQTRNTARFARFNRLVHTVLPDVRQVLAPPEGNQLRIQVWSVDPDSERADLAVPLSESGSGIGQVLAVLYLVVTSDHPRTIIIDEPQSYLHPGAIRKLFDVLRAESRHSHQYIITTHSPTVITAAEPRTALMVRKVEAESQIETIDVQQTQQLRDALADVGARLADVFGADSVLWVEGRTEEECFPRILTRVANRPLLGTSVLGLVNTGDLQGRHADTVVDIYQRLSGGGGLLPPAIGFVFDREDRTPQELEDLERRLRGQVHFLPRRTFENYLLNPRAIAALASNIDDFTPAGVPTTAEQIQSWIDANGWNRKYVSLEGGRASERWLRQAHGARILADIFSELSECRVQYLKVEYGKWLTDWLITNSPEDLTELAEFLSDLLPTNAI